MNAAAKGTGQAMHPAGANLDFVRAAAVLCVFCSHAVIIVTRQSSELLHHVGQLGVIMFFVHTSYVLMGSLERSRLWGWPRVAEFFVHRVFRIYPLAIVCVLVAAALPGSAWTPRQLLANLTLTQNLVFEESMVGGLWTLPLELQMYCALPFLFMAFRRRPAWWMVGAWLLALPIAHLRPEISGRLLVLDYAPCFLPGLVAWRFGRHGVLPGWLWPPAVLLAALPWVASDGNQMGPRWITCLLLGLAIPWFGELSARWLNRASHIVAKYSYGIYLTHFAALMVAFRSLDHLPLAVQAGAFVAMALVFPYLAFHLVEQPMIAVGKRVGGRVAGAMMARRHGALA
ncbi:acyltransferase family protein [Massilia dura]|uniref:Acyltransferase family protein n=1 Tax=Pseudoduganella dura TaxID=321982 RepID=A0A6I3X6D1_9BURK|nr:acyltransferase [Pseudoduganella dura]MUI12304.1 acyltransferase family protein [Pseudoduganella dura]GGY07143.1 acyltransferase [Pseudoduganella dura]